MSLRQFSLTDFRNLQSTTLDFHPSINLVYGENGSGKTSLLEAIHVNCQAQSFRQRQLKKCIKHGSDRFLLFGKFETHKKVSRWTFPIWLYVSVTGVIVFFMLKIWG